MVLPSRFKYPPLPLAFLSGTQAVTEVSLCLRHRDTGPGRHVPAVLFWSLVRAWPHKQNPPRLTFSPFFSFQPSVSNSHPLCSLHRFPAWQWRFNVVAVAVRP
jgi:hypothetical protein